MAMKPPVKTAVTVFDVIEAVRKLDKATVTTIADELGRAKSTVHDHLVTLEEMRYVVKDDDGYRLSLRFLEQGMHAASAYDIDDIAASEMAGLAETTDEVVWLVVEEHGLGIYLQSATGSKAVQTHGRVGMSTYLHAISAGKAILAELTEDRVQSIIERHGLPELTPHTITSETELFEELDRIRDRGIAYNKGETIEGLRGVGCPITHDGTVFGAIGVGGPAERMPDDVFRHDIPDALRGAVNAVELSLRDHH